MTLYEMSAQYRESAAALRARIAQLRQAERSEEDTEAAAAARRRIDALLPMLRECRDLAGLTAHYYDRSYHKNEHYTL